MTEDNNGSRSQDAPNSGSNVSPSAKSDYFSPGLANAKLVYILYFVMLLPSVLGLIGIPTAGILGLAGIAGFVFALMNKSIEDPVLKSHYEFQFNTGWKGIVIAVAAFLLMFVLIGVVIYVALFVWWAIRCYKGWELLAQGKAHPNPDTWALD